MKKSELSDMVCSLANALTQVGDTWKILILKELFLRNRRFDGIARQTGMSSFSLSTRLAELERDDIIVKKLYEEHPPRHEYLLTQKGLDLWPVLVGLKEWGDNWIDQNPERPLRYVHKDCGAVTSPMLVCSECHEPIDARHASIAYSEDAERYRIEQSRRD